jgi:HEAT repeat protein
MRRGVEQLPGPKPEVADEEALARARYVVAQVEQIALKEDNLDRVGYLSMQPTARLLDLGKKCSPVLVQIIRDREKDWKLRYWACDLMGYLGDRANIIPLIERIEDATELYIIRKCAVRAIEEMDFPEVIKDLRAAYDIVRNESIKREIARVLIRLGG